MAGIDDSTQSALLEGLNPGEHPYNLRRAMERFERGYLHNILVLNSWDIGETARMLGISTKSLIAKMKRYEMH